MTVCGGVGHCAMRLGVLECFRCCDEMPCNEVCGALSKSWCGKVWFFRFSSFLGRAGSYPHPYPHIFVFKLSLLDLLE